MSNAGKGGRRGTNGNAFFPGGKAQPTGAVSTQTLPDLVQAEEDTSALPSSDRQFVQHALGIDHEGVSKALLSTVERDLEKRKKRRQSMNQSASHDEPAWAAPITPETVPDLQTVAARGQELRDIIARTKDQEVYLVADRLQAQLVERAKKLLWDDDEHAVAVQHNGELDARRAIAIGRKCDRDDPGAVPFVDVRGRRQYRRPYDEDELVEVVAGGYARAEERRAYTLAHCGVLNDEEDVNARLSADLQEGYPHAPFAHQALQFSF
jgi:hypothetical protein